jgi:hypothetical protein
MEAPQADALDLNLNLNLSLSLRAEGHIPSVSVSALLSISSILFYPQILPNSNVA